MLKKIQTEHLEVGMYVADFNTPWLNHPFLTSRKLIRKAAEIDVIREHGISELYIDTERGSGSPRAHAPAEVEPDLRQAGIAEDAAPPGTPPEREAQGAAKVVQQPAPDEIPFEEELRKASAVYDEAKVTIRDLYQEVRMGKSVDGQRVRSSVGGMIDSIFRNRDALLSLARLKSYDDYTFQHSLNVTVLSINLGSQLGILHNELLRLGIGAMLHDLGKVFVPEAVLNKAGPLNDDEFELIRTHPAHGAKLLMDSDSVPDECATVALNHHERYDGGGYPRGLSGLEAGKFGLIAAIADVYDAMTTNRSYQQRFPPHVTLKRVYEWAGTHFHPIYVRKFIQCLGIYPTGTVVELDTGYVGVVYRQNREELLKPWVRVCRSPEGTELQAPLDLDLHRRDGPEGMPPAGEITRVLDPRQVGVNEDRVLQPHQQPEPGNLTVVLG